MLLHLLDNPVWHSLTTYHANFAVGSNEVKRYPSTVAPFLATPASGAVDARHLSQLLAGDEASYFVGIAPQFPASWEIEATASILQMVCSDRVDETENASEIVLLSEVDLPAMLSLTTLVYPEFFRTRTPALGAYVGIFENGKLVAMAGERFHLTDYQEISAVCTHPDFLGRGYAGRLISHLVNLILTRNEIPFLHVAANNERAKSLYERHGFQTRCALPLWRLKRQA